MSDAVIREMYGKFNRGDTVGAAEILHPEGELHQNPELPDADVYRGREAFEEGLNLFGVPLETEVFHVWEVRDSQPFRCRVFLGEEESRQEAGLGQ